MAATIAAVAAIMAVMAWIVYGYTHGNMDEDVMMAACSMLSGALMVVVVLFGIYVYKAPSASEQYRRMLEEKEKRGDRAPSEWFHWLDFQSPCLLQYSQATTFSASVLKKASGASPGLRYFLMRTPSAQIWI